MPFASLCVFTYAYRAVLSKCHRKEPQRSSCGLNILPQRSSCAFIVQPQRSSCGFQDSSSSDPQSAARRTSSCGSKKKFLRVHYFWAVLYIGRYVDQHLGRDIGRVSTDMSVDISVDTWPICWPIYRSRGAQNTHDPMKYWNEIPKKAIGNYP